MCPLDLPMTCSSSIYMITLFNRNLKINFQQKDARLLDFKNEFDVVIMLCEGGFPLMETDEMNYKILNNAANALKKSGKFIFTTLPVLGDCTSFSIFIDSTINRG